MSDGTAIKLRLIRSAPDHSASLGASPEGRDAEAFHPMLPEKDSDRGLAAAVRAAESTGLIRKNLGGAAADLGHKLYSSENVDRTGNPGLPAGNPGLPAGNTASAAKAAGGPVDAHSAEADLLVDGAGPVRPAQADSHSDPTDPRPAELDSAHPASADLDRSALVYVPGPALTAFPMSHAANSPRSGPAEAPPSAPIDNAWRVAPEASARAAPSNSATSAAIHVLLAVENTIHAADTAIRAAEGAIRAAAPPGDHTSLDASALGPAVDWPKPLPERRIRFRLGLCLIAAVPVAAVVAMLFVGGFPNSNIGGGNPTADSASLDPRLAPAAAEPPVDPVLPEKSAAAVAVVTHVPEDADAMSPLGPSLQVEGPGEAQVAGTSIASTAIAAAPALVAAALPVLEGQGRGKVDAASPPSQPPQMAEENPAGALTASTGIASSAMAAVQPGRSPQVAEKNPADAPTAPPQLAEEDSAGTPVAGPTTAPTAASPRGGQSPQVVDQDTAGVAIASATTGSATIAAPSTSEPAPPVVHSFDPEEITLLRKRGEDLVSAGDIAAGRLLLQRAAQARDAQASLVLGATYDPIVLERLGVRGVVADIAMARAWYETAKALGSDVASTRLEALSDRDRMIVDRLNRR